ncbi:MAG TPA: hypothetical protein IAB18_02330 [Candidatus Avisuccinivibrio pullicola]|nr:hypothetical protein [Candidatus Avisuccinivibrio pullicola]
MGIFSNLLLLLILTAAALWALRRVLRARRLKRSCAGCPLGQDGSCGKTGSAAEKAAQPAGTCQNIPVRRL